MTGFDAIVLAGGRSSRLGGSPKALLVRAGRTLLDAPAGLADRDALLAQPEGGGPQYLVGLYRRSALERAFAEQRPAGRSVRSLLAQLRWSTVAVPAGSCDDVDTRADAVRLGWVERTSPTA